jgi:thiol-disulfide isomerase/thioredoxin
MMKRFFVLFFLILCAAGCGSQKNGTDLIPKSDRIVATEIDASFINYPNSSPAKIKGQSKRVHHKKKREEVPSLNLAKLKGRVVVLDFWATWCGPCRMEIPSFVKLYPLYHPKGLEIVGLSVETLNSQPAGYFDQFIKNFSIPYPTGFAGANTIKAYGIESIPATYFIDKTGKIAQVFIGVHPEAEITGAIEKLLSE